VQNAALVLRFRLLKGATVQNYEFNLAIAPSDVQAYFALRYQIFVQEQGLFSDQVNFVEADDLDAIAYPIVAQLQVHSLMICC
jgi:hypothetical protein